MYIYVMFFHAQRGKEKHFKYKDALQITYTQIMGKYILAFMNVNMATPINYMKQKT